METVITAVAGREIHLRSRLGQRGVTFPNTKSKSLHNKFDITVSIQGVKEKFSFYDSQENFEKGNRDITDDVLKHTFRYFVSDADFGTYSFEDFCLELGYDSDSRTAERVYKGCKKSLKKLLALGFCESEIVDIINDLSEQGIE